MKKTMIAMAVAGVVAAPMASAEVSISGVVEQTFTDTKSDANGWDTSTFNMLNFKASEDLGNGMSAFAKYNFLDKTGSTGGTTNGDNVVGISSDMGTIVAGTMEDFTEGKLAAMMTMEGNTLSELSGNALRTQGGFAYISPTINGFHIGAAGFAGSGAADTSMFDAVDVAAFYDNGPLSLKFARETLNGEKSRASVAAVEGVVPTTSVAYVAPVTAVAVGEEQQTTSFGASYTIGDLKISALMVERDNQGGVSTADSDDSMIRADYTIGNNKITIVNADDDSASNTITGIEVIHNFSSRTSAYAGTTSGDNDSNDSAYFGLKHKF